MGAGALWPPGGEDNARVPSLCFLIAAMIGATFIKLGRAPTTLMIFILESFGVVAAIAVEMPLLSVAAVEQRRKATSLIRKTSIRT